MCLLCPATSPDDDYFDGYKSADSKPSDSTSQFSTDQSDGDDFKNFDNYLDEFQRKREQQDKESPLHRPITKLKNTSPQTSIASKTPPKISMFPMPPKSQPVSSQHKTTPTMSFFKEASLTTQTDNADDFSDFADFHSAPFAPQSSAAPKTPATDDVLKDPKSVIPPQDLIGDEDKYAALRSMDFSMDLMDTSTLSSPPPTQTTAPVDEDDDWADFTTSSAGFGEQTGDATLESSKGEKADVGFAADFQQASWEGEFEY